MNNVVKRLITVLISLFLISYVAYQAYLALYNPLRTVRAESSTVRDFISADAFVVHDETLIQASTGSGVIDYTRADGESVAVGGVVANVYATVQVAENHNKLQGINDRIARLKQAGTYDGTTQVDLSALDEEIDGKFLSLADAASSSGLDKLDDTEPNLIDLLNKKQLATGEVNNFDAEIASLQQQASVLSPKSVSGVINIVSPVSGCFVSTIDGFEGMYDISKILDIKTSDIQRLMAAKTEVKSGTIGKVISEYQWYVTCVLSSDDALKLKVGNQISVQFLLSSESEVPVTVMAINKSGDSCAVVLQCDYMTGKLAVMRRQSIQIVTRDITGIKIANDYIHIVNGQKGVFVLEGNTVGFRNIVLVYSGNGYTMSGIDSSDSKRLQVYDSVIENGDDLYDGKVIK
jgi:hypothetical protein